MVDCRVVCSWGGVVDVGSDGVAKLLDSNEGWFRVCRIYSVITLKKT